MTDMRLECRLAACLLGERQLAASGIRRAGRAVELPRIGDLVAVRRVTRRSLGALLEQHEEDAALGADRVEVRVRVRGADVQAVARAHLRDPDHLRLGQLEDEPAAEQRDDEGDERGAAEEQAQLVAQLLAQRGSAVLVPFAAIVGHPRERTRPVTISRAASSRWGTRTRTRRAAGSRPARRS